MGSIDYHRFRRAKSSMECAVQWSAQNFIVGEKVPHAGTVLRKAKDIMLAAFEQAERALSIPRHAGEAQRLKVLAFSYTNPALGCACSISSGNLSVAADVAPCQVSCLSRSMTALRMHCCISKEARPWMHPSRILHCNFYECEHRDLCLEHRNEPEIHEKL